MAAEQLEVYLLRHGIAEEGRPGGRDADRALTPEGKRRLRDTLAVAKAAGAAPQLLLSSPYRRAVESARIAGEVFGFKGQIIESSAFTPMADVRQAWDEIRLYSGTGSLLIASHEPLTGLLTGYLCGTPNLPVDVKKGSVTRVDLDQAGTQPRGVLKWILTPRLAGATRD